MGKLTIMYKDGDRLDLVDARVISMEGDMIQIKHIYGTSGSNIAYIPKESVHAIIPTDMINDPIKNETKKVIYVNYKNNKEERDNGRD